MLTLCAAEGQAVVAAVCTWTAHLEVGGLFPWVLAGGQSGSQQQVPKS